MKFRHRLHIILVSMLMCIIGITACGENVWDELPSDISSFLSQYFPGVGISSYNETNDTYYINLRNDASMVFDSNYKWTDILGNGSPLPADLVFDQLPSPLYDYLQSTEHTTEVYSMSRNHNVYTVTLLDSKIQYDIVTQTVTYVKG